MLGYEKYLWHRKRENGNLIYYKYQIYVIYYREREILPINVIVEYMGNIFECDE